MRSLVDTKDFRSCAFDESKHLHEHKTSSLLYGTSISIVVSVSISKPRLILFCALKVCVSCEETYRVRELAIYGELKRS
jgi:hypothetical protein